VLFLKDINLPRPDKYDTCALIAFLQQLVTFKGFYDEHLEFLGIERVHIVCTMNPATTVGRHPLSTRFTAIVRIAFMDYPDSSELTTVYSAYMQAALQPGPQVHRCPRSRHAFFLNCPYLSVVCCESGVPDIGLRPRVADDVSWCVRVPSSAVSRAR
jgi:hypothetical protein